MGGQGRAPTGMLAMVLASPFRHAHLAVSAAAARLRGPCADCNRAAAKMMLLLLYIGERLKLARRVEVLGSSNPRVRRAGSPTTFRLFPSQFPALQVALHF